MWGQGRNTHLLWGFKDLNTHYTNILYTYTIHTYYTHALYLLYGLCSLRLQPPHHRLPHPLRIRILDLRGRRPNKNHKRETRKRPVAYVNKLKSPDLAPGGQKKDMFYLINTCTYLGEVVVYLLRGVYMYIYVYICIYIRPSSINHWTIEHKMDFEKKIVV
jgi:hypothetical protein